MNTTIVNRFSAVAAVVACVSLLSTAVAVPAFAVDGDSAGASDGATVSDGAWPYDPLEISPATLTGAHVEDFADEDMSGIDFGSDGTVYVVNNGTGHLYVLTPGDGNSYTIDGRYRLRYPDGSGTPDAEGMTVGPDGAIYVATERDNDGSRTSRPSVLRFDLAETDGTDGELHATGEWNLSDLTGSIEPNKGPETVTWIPDDEISAFFAVEVEENGEILFVSLEDDSRSSLVQRYDTPFEGVMASDYDAATGELTILCDDTCAGESQVLRVDDSGEFAPAGEVHARPENLEDLNNEGYARFVEPDGTKRFLWSDDNATDGVSLRGAVR